MNILISGSTGFVGTYLKNKFKNDGYNIFELKRNDFNLEQEEFKKKFEKIDIVINLAGAPIVGKWSEKYKEILYKSRINTTQKIVDTIGQLKNKPKLFINSSAVGIYQQGLTHDEYSTNFDKGFLGKLSHDWELEALKNKNNSRTIITRFGVVLGKGGFLGKLLPIFRLGIGGRIGNGNFNMNFVDIEDIYRFYKHSIEEENISGIYNLSNINIKNKDFTKIFGKVLKRMTLIPVPKFALQILYGEGSSILFSNIEVYPKKTNSSGFKFKNKDLESILRKYI